MLEATEFIDFKEDTTDLIKLEAKPEPEDLEIAPSSDNTNTVISEFGVTVVVTNKRQGCIFAQNRIFLPNPLVQK